ncbi:unnamed protein product [Orchesella dallaii]|uniref:Ionotropic glutamate receptor C-terminal domain-containing protein n=1 Tax=Orchesella dallaii TaxID=48710 RepID=A0ABP1QDK1_9HEXA
MKPATFQSLILSSTIVLTALLPVACNTPGALGNDAAPFLVNNIRHCKSFILHDHQYSNQNFDSLSEMVSAVSSGLFIAHILNNTFNATEPFTKVVDVPKSRPTCTVGIIYITTPSSIEYLGSWHTFLQKCHGIVKTDNDSFFYLSQSESLVDKMLTSDTLGKRVKFNVGISETFQMDRSVMLRSVCHFCENTETILSASTNAEADFSKIFIDRSKNLLGTRLRISTPTSTRGVNEMHTVDNHWVPKRGIYSIVLNQLMLKYNFTAEFFPSTGGGTGGKINKTHWTGTVGDVLGQKADIGHVTALTFSRSIVVDSTFPVSYEWLTFTTGQPRSFHSWKTVYWPFTPTVWHLTTFVSVLMAIMFKIVLKFTGQRSKLNKIVEYMLAVITEEGVADPEQYPTYSLRLTIVLWLLFSLLMSTAYRSKLTAFLAFPNLERLPQSFEELSDSKYSIGLQYIKGAAYAMLKSSKNPTYMKIFNKMDLEESDVRCFKRTIASDFACISWDSIADYVYHKNLTDKFGQAPVVKAPTSTYFITAGMVMEKRSILKMGFDRFLISVADSGIMSKWRFMDYEYIAQQRKYWEKDTNQPETDYTVPENAALTLGHLSGGYYLLVIGLVLSVTSFGMEQASKLMLKCKKTDPCENIEFGEKIFRSVKTLK